MRSESERQVRRGKKGGERMITDAKERDEKKKNRIMTTFEEQLN